MTTTSTFTTEERQHYLGGSDIPAIMGVDPYKTSLQLYLEKKGLWDEQVDNLHTRFGKHNEEFIAQEYSLLTGNTLQPVAIKVHPQYPYLVAHIDRIILADGKAPGIFEAKTSAFGKRYHSFQHEQLQLEQMRNVPIEYYVQCQYYMALTGYAYCHLVVLIGGREIKVYELEANQDWQKNILLEATNFWENYILKNVQPKPQIDHTTTLALLKKIHGDIQDTTIELSSNIMQDHFALIECQNKITELEKQIFTLKQEADKHKSNILYHMGKNAIGVVPGLGRYVQKIITKKSYVVTPKPYVDFRFRADKN